MAAEGSFFVGTTAALASAALAITSCIGNDVGAARFTEENIVVEAPTSWAGENLVIDIDGAGKGGLDVVFDGTASKVIARATIVVVADGNDKASADLAATEVKAGFAITTANGVTTVRCVHGATHGTAQSADSGCEKATVVLPVPRLATAAFPPAPEPGPLLVTLDVTSALGDVLVAAEAVSLYKTTIVATKGNVELASNAVFGSSIVARSESAGTVRVHVPADFAADAIVLDAVSGTIDTSAFPDVASGRGRGPAGQGAASIQLVSVPTGGAGGTIILSQ